MVGPAHSDLLQRGAEGGKELGGAQATGLGGQLRDELRETVASLDVGQLVEKDVAALPLGPTIAVRRDE